MNKPILFVKHRTYHHAGHSGYSKLIESVGGDYIPGPDDKYYIPFKMRRIISSWPGNKGGLYNAESLRKELLLLSRMFEGKGGIAHYLNAERDIWYSPRFKDFFKWKMTATYHKPPDVIKSSIRSFTSLRKLDGHICVGANQVDFLKEAMRTEKVKYIPHGIDTDFFQPETSPERTNAPSAVFVGYHLRDIPMLIQTVSMIRKHFQDFECHIVMSEEHHSKFPTDSGFVFYHKISDSELRSLYIRTHFTLLPLKDATACNSLLEAMACGAAVVVSDVGGMRAYAGEQGALLSKHHPEALAEASIRLLEQTELIQQLRDRARIQAENFSWTKIGSAFSACLQDWFEN